jgi:D-alanyl-D-alanine carboxypeptidase
MNELKYKQFLLWGIFFLFIEVILILSYFNFSDKEIEVRDQLAQIFTSKTNRSSEFPVLKQNSGELALSADSFISVLVTNDNLEKILIEKNKSTQLPIASITKLMTAVIASEKYKLDEVVAITENSLKIDGLSGIYKEGDHFFYYNALRAMLIASHNEIANTLAEQAGLDTFIGLMNKKALELGLLNTNFVNVTGLDPEISGGPINHSTVYDIYKLARYIKENNSDIFYITTQKEFGLFDIDKRFIATIKNTDKLLSEQDLPFLITGGKTGETDIAKQNLLVVAETPCGGNLFNVVLGSQNRFEDMKKIIQHINNSYDWICSN